MVQLVLLGLSLIIISPKLALVAAVSYMEYAPVEGNFKGGVECGLVSENKNALGLDL